VKRPTMLVEAILRQASMDLGLSVERDVATMRHRCEHEGLSFLTIILPKLSDSLEKGLEDGRLSCPSDFARHGRLPRFMGGFFSRVFTIDGELRHDACPDSILFIRQVSRFFKKLELGCSPSRNKKAIQHFVDVEAELRNVTPQIERKDDVLDTISGILWSQVFPEIDPLDLVCHHGPGSTADRLLPNGRNHISKWNHRSEFLFPSDLHCFPNYGFAAQAGSIQGEGDIVRGPDYLELRDELPVRIVFVPKTMTTPRVIAMEPSHMQYIQQSIKDLVYYTLENHSMTRNSIRFSDQRHNQLLAHSSSIDKRASTLDLKDASDRVHLHLVQRIFKTSGLLQYLEDARSLHATLPDGRNIVLSKYASMGSALCFPVEAMVFYTLVLCAMHQLDGTRPSTRSIKRYSRSISVYGDDIIVPVEYTDVVVRYLESYALKVNVSKSFSKGNFRESCGADYFKGTSVRPIYARQYPHDVSQAWRPKDVMSWVDISDHFYLNGMWIVSQAIRDMVNSVVRRTIPVSQTAGAGLAYYSMLYTTDLSYNKDLQCWQQKRLVYQPTLKKDDIDGNALACFNKWSSGNRPTRQDPGYGNYFRSVYARGSISSGSSEAEVIAQGHRPLGGFHFHEASNSAVGSGGIQNVSLSDEASGQKMPYSLFGVDSGCRPLDLPTARVLSPECRSYVQYCEQKALLNSTDYLSGRSVGLDFRSSTKRGCFKSKSRWVPL